MEISFRDLLTVTHGLAFGTLFMLAFSGAIGQLYGCRPEMLPASVVESQMRMLRFYLVAMVILAWAAVLTGSYIVYPWYRATPPPGTVDLSAFPQSLLLSDPNTAGWHELGMEWKEHVAWFAPIAMTMVAYVVGTYGPRLTALAAVRKVVLWFVIVAFASTGVAAFFGVFLNKHAPVRGGSSIQLYTPRG